MASGRRRSAPGPARCLATALPGRLLAGVHRRAADVGRAIACTPGLGALHVTVHPGDEPALCLWADLDDARAEQLTARLRSLPVALGRLRYVSERRARGLCRRLADRLAAHLGREALSESAFAAIPRGGHLVLGWLSYVLDLRREQLSAEALRTARRVVVVDDGACTGHRFGGFLAGLQADEVVFAHLVSPPSLRKAIEAAEPRVTACVAAQDLAEFPDPASLPPLAERLRRLPPPRYWAGSTELLAFEWSEPDGFAWSPETGEPVPTFRLVPPERCLANRPQPGVTVVETEAPSGAGPLQPSPRALWLLTPGRSLLADRATLEVLELKGAAAAIWRGLLRRGHAAGILEDLRAEFDAPEAVLRADLDRFLEELGTRGLIVTEAGRGA